MLSGHLCQPDIMKSALAKNSAFVRPDLTLQTLESACRAYMTPGEGSWSLQASEGCHIGHENA